MAEQNTQDEKKVDETTIDETTTGSTVDTTTSESNEGNVEENKDEKKKEETKDTKTTTKTGLEEEIDDSQELEHSDRRTSPREKGKSAEKGDSVFIQFLKGLRDGLVDLLHRIIDPKGFRERRDAEIDLARINAGLNPIHNSVMYYKETMGIEVPQPPIITKAAPVQGDQNHTTTIDPNKKSGKDEKTRLDQTDPQKDQKAELTKEDPNKKTEVKLTPEEQQQIDLADEALRIMEERKNLTNSQKEDIIPVPEQTKFSKKAGYEKDLIKRINELNEDIDKLPECVKSARELEIKSCQKILEKIQAHKGLDIQKELDNIIKSNGKQKDLQAERRYLYAMGPEVLLNKSMSDRLKSIQQHVYDDARTSEERGNTGKIDNTLKFYIDRPKACYYLPKEMPQSMIRDIFIANPDTINYMPKEAQDALKNENGKIDLGVIESVIARHSAPENGGKENFDKLQTYLESTPNGAVFTEAFAITEQLDKGEEIPKIENEITLDENGIPNLPAPSKEELEKKIEEEQRQKLEAERNNDEEIEESTAKKRLTNTNEISSEKKEENKRKLNELSSRSKDTDRSPEKEREEAEHDVDIR